MNRRYLVGAVPLLLILVATLAVPVHGSMTFHIVYFDRDRDILDWVFVGSGYRETVFFFGWNWGYWYITDGGSLTWKYEIVTFTTPGMSDYYLHAYAIFLRSQAFKGDYIPPGKVDFYFADKLYGGIDFDQRTMRVNCGEETQEYSLSDITRWVTVRVYLRVLDGTPVPGETKIVAEIDHVGTYELSCSYLHELAKGGKITFQFTGRYVHIRPGFEGWSNGVTSIVVAWDVEVYPALLDLDLPPEVLASDEPVERFPR
ncbi:MAG: hypothetical protein QXM08_00335 [Thermofilaceae archaeon]